MINWGIIGCGDVTEIKSGPAFNRVPASKLVAVMRRNAVKAEDYARRHSVRRWYSKVEDILKDEEVNAVYVATPPLWHEAYTLAALEAGKAVYVEKPMAMNALAAQRMVDAAHKLQQKLSVAHYRREIALFKKVKELLSQEAIGKVHAVQLTFHQPADTKVIAATENNWRLDAQLSGGGLFHDLAPHQLDLLLYFFGNPLEASGKAYNIAGLYPVPDAVDATLKFSNQIEFIGSWRFTAPAHESEDTVEIKGSKGVLKFACFNHSSLLVDVGGQIQQMTFAPDQHVQEPMIKEVVRYFNGDGANPCSGEEGLVVMQMIDRITSPS